MNKSNRQLLAKGVKELGLELNDKQLKQFEIYSDFLREFSKHTNITRILDERDIVIKHFLDSLAAYFLVTPPLSKGEKLPPPPARGEGVRGRGFDYGAGAGFPLVPLKIAFPYLDITLVESKKKPAEFLKQLIEKLDLKNTRVLNIRIEDVEEKFDFGVARAAGPIDEVIQNSSSILKDGGKMFVYVGKRGNIPDKYDYHKIQVPFLEAERGVVISPPFPKGDPALAGGGFERERGEIILAIESSCDETAAAVAVIEKVPPLPKSEMIPPPPARGAGVRGRGVKILSSIVSSQLETHAAYGGVVPEVAARMHVENIIPVINKAIKEARVTKYDISKIAVTWEPGLPPSLLVGRATAEALAVAWNKPLVKVDHIKGHIYANWIVSKSHGDLAVPKLPAIALIVSGGHTGLWLITQVGKERQLGSTIDDAAGEAYDKVARLLGLGYPGGPAISEAAENGDPKKYDFPRPLLDKDNYDFSFSGLKTAVRVFVETPHWGVEDVAASFDQAVTDVLVEKTIKAAEEYKVKTVILGGGVANNKRLREVLSQRCEENSITPSMAEREYCGDNAAMIAVAAFM